MKTQIEGGVIVKQTTDQQMSSSPQQREPAKQEARLTLRAWLVKKLIQYIDNTMQTLFTAAVLGGALWIVQRFWGLRLLPFNILDTILIAVASAFGMLILISVILWLLFKWILKEFPGFFFLLGLAALVSLWAGKQPGLFKGALNMDFSTAKKSPSQEQQHEATKPHDPH